MRAKRKSQASITKHLHNLFTCSDVMGLAPKTPFFRSEPNFLDDWLNETYAAIKKIVNDIASLQIESQFVPCSLDFIFGPNWPGHALNARPVFWYKKLSEPNLTQLLAHTMEYEARERGTSALCTTFLHALFGCLPENAPQWIIPAKCPISVVAEQRVAGDKRIDLLFKWEHAKKMKLVAIEVKFDAVNTNPLEEYEDYCHKALQNCGDTDVEGTLLQCCPVKHP